ncbi:ADP-ribose pyrophosphatase YjhB (NUDIX family) [Novosphingobium sp. PhB57]|uniref:NUDIX hydrolase n=1 Tax=Novosphingobium sp. PhB57 TaxID=2485107 RepID=UPI00104C0866|nr:NUDIX hydrolase [Novosphingobium sp. PhB57]TCU49261.1 ADP-ribose pyrophosphatase YjhB (NUDIX family) [Novosphingobium sp. PhB57]
MALQTHALPYRLVGDSFEVLLVTSRRKRKWILPKGKIEIGETAAQRAAIEAFEEAGVRGTVSAKPLLASSLADPSRAHIYPLAVLEELEQWPEMALRQRAWFSFPEARARLKNEGVLHALDSFAATIFHDGGPVVPMG